MVFILFENTFILQLDCGADGDNRRIRSRSKEKNIIYWILLYWKTSCNPHPTFNSHNHPMRKVLPSKFCKDKREGWRNYIYFPKGHCKLERQDSNSGFDNYFSIKGQRINIFGCVGHMVSVAVIHLCGFITEAAIGLPWWLSGKEFACQCMRQGFDPWLRKIPHVIEQLNLYTTTIESVL